MKSWRLALAGLAGGLALFQVTCHQALFTAPPDSSLSLIANPTSIPANTGISVITAIVTEPSGSPVADGTVVQFFTTLGRIDEQGRTNDGVARVNLYADSRSGVAEVTASSGGPVTGGGGTTTTTTPSPTTTLTTSHGVQSKASSAAAASDSVSVTIGGAIPASMFVTANPRRITSPRSSTIAAYVFDGDGNPVANVPVFFTVDLPEEGVLQETLDSNGSPRFTDNNGRAADTLRTSYDPAERPKIVTVRATVPGVTESTVTVGVN